MPATPNPFTAEHPVVGYTLVPDRLADFHWWTGARRKLPSCWWYVCYLLSPSAIVRVLGTIDGEGRCGRLTVHQNVFL